MDIQSTSQPKHLLSANPKEGHEKDVSKERIQSTEPELESLGAVGGEGVSYTPDTERRTVATTASPTTTLDTFSAHDKKQNSLYGIHPILPSSAFTKEHLEQIYDATKPLSRYILDYLPSVEVKLATLRVQALIIKMIRGEDSDKETQPLIRNINKLILKCFKDAPKHTIPALDSHALWPINKDDCKNPAFTAMGQLEAKAYRAEFEKYLADSSRKKTEKEKSNFKDIVEAILKKIQTYDASVNHLNQPDATSNIPPPHKKTTENPTYLFIPEKDIESIYDNNPDLRSTIERHNVFLVSLALTRANDFEKKLLACYNLSIDFDDQIFQTAPEPKPFFFLDVYKELLRNDITRGKLTAFQTQQIACTWVMALSNYFLLYNKMAKADTFKEKLYKAYDAASQYSFFPVIIEIWHSLGLSPKHHSWITSIKLRPEYALEYLIKMGQQKQNLLLMEEEMDDIAKITLEQDSYTPEKKDWIAYPIFYCYLVGKEEVGRALLPHGRTHWHELFVFTSLVAHERFEESVTRIEKCLTKDKRQISLEVKELRIKALPLLALVHKRLADTETCDKKRTMHLEKALSYLSKQAPIHKELYLSLAIIQEQLNDLKSAYTSYTTLEKHCKTFPKESAENCQLQFISQAKEQLTDRMFNSPDNTPPEESALQKPENHEIPIIRKKPKQKILTTQITPQLTPEEKEEEIIVPVASLRMDKLSETDIERKEPEECIHNLTLEYEECAQKDNDTNWTVVKKRPLHSSESRMK